MKKVFKNIDNNRKTSILFSIQFYKSILQYQCQNVPPSQILIPELATPAPF